jgi:hypothetical protein
METTEKLTEDIGLLINLSNDLSFDLDVLEDSKSLISIKNNEIIGLGGSPVDFDLKEEIGIAQSEAVKIVLKKLKAIYKIKDVNETSKKKYKSYDFILRMSTKMSYEDYLKNGEKFSEGGAVLNYKTDTLSVLEKTNQFYKLRLTENDSMLKYRTPDKSVLYQVLLPNAGIAFAVAYPMQNNMILDFYQDEDLSQSLNVTYSFADGLSDESFSVEYNKMMKDLSEIEKKYY